MTGPTIVPASRRGLTGDTAIGELPEVRQIFFVSGIQFNHGHFLGKLAEDAADPSFTPAERAERTDQFRQQMFPEGLVDAIPQLFTLDDGVKQQAFHFNADQNVLYTIESADDKAGYISALLTQGALVIYGGHARFGRGPCFGSSDKPGDDWENGANPATGGLFRMGFPFLAVPMHEFVEHGYHTTPLPGTDPKPTAVDSEPDLRRRLGILVRRRVVQMHVDRDVVEKVAELFGVDPDGDETFWTFVAVDLPEFGSEVHVVLKAHWKDTISDPTDLGAVEPQCRVFCHFGCSTFQHNFPVLRKFRKWVRRGDDRHAYWTTDVSTNITATIFLKHLLTAPGVQAGRLWEPWLTRAVQLTNRELRTKRAPHQII